ncbi:hypothetical protein GCM10009838_79430 [Catenulispora subtropica]|uniref:Uncharacterized protein n=1 Tax=Catenulispora subtropica TaxID=450798 RepID=A0ABN2T8J3_9ACTN
MRECVRWAIYSAAGGVPLPLSKFFVTGLAPEGQIVVTGYAILRIPVPEHEAAPVARTGAASHNFLISTGYASTAAAAASRAATASWYSRPAR